MSAGAQAVEDGTHCRVQVPTSEGPAATMGWFHSAWFPAAITVSLAFSLTTGLSTGAPLAYLAGQAMMACSFYVSMGLLADRPLLNPVQTGAVVFYWWFSIGPTVVSGVGMLSNTAAPADYSTLGLESLGIVAAGLPLYALASRWTLQWLERSGLRARFLCPEGTFYREQTILFWLVAWLGSSALLFILEQLGYEGITESDFLGGTVTSIWWIGVIAAVGTIAPFLRSAFFVLLLHPQGCASQRLRLLAVLTIVHSAVAALASGWKGAFVSLAVYFLAALISRTQRVPWLLLAVCLTIYLVVLQPFVAYGRWLAESSGIETSEDRKALFRDLATSGEFRAADSWDNINIQNLFRGIYPLAGEVTRRNGWFHGEWQGDTFWWGFEALVPRVLYPAKRDLNIGNFFYHEVQCPLYGEYTDNEIVNVTISVPFEFLGNFGRLPGIASFALLGIIWSMWCGWMLSPQRMSSHPLAPLLIWSTFSFEAPFGHFLAFLRGFLVPMAVAYLIWHMLKRKA